ncbi:MAG: type II toxin-antitoxin system YoeB family toxin [Sulfurovum sp.]|nr:type II toxin-antitoxin system YoeB family toxin [Sulfurovaceae bacterium]
MIYKINILENANNDLNYLRRNDKSSYIKVFDFLREMMIDPRSGTGRSERLKYFDKEVYSRGVNQKDRIVYTIYEYKKEIDISSCVGHY